MSKADKIFKETIERILSEGFSSEGHDVRPKWDDGSPAHTISVLNVMHQYDLRDEFPITTLRPTAWKSGLKEIMWIYLDQTSDLNVLRDKYNIQWWDSWGKEDDTIGTAYGWVVNNYKLIDKLIEGIKTHPLSRRHIMSLYQHEHLDGGSLQPCAFQTIWNVNPVENTLNMTLFQRSSDFICAGNINATQYALLLHMVAQVTGYTAGVFTHYIENCHIYDRHVLIAKELLEREEFDAPKLWIDPNIDTFYDFTVDSFKLIDYNKGSQIKIPVAI